MFDVIGLFLIVIFAPIIIINGMKYYKIRIDKSAKVLAYILLGCELFRFFYTAQFYERAYMPADKVTFTFITFSVVIVLFAALNKSCFGKICKTLVVYTSLIPIIMALIYPHIYINEYDTYAVCKALYFAETGIIISVAILFMKDEIKKINIKSLLFSLAFVFIYIFANAMRNIFWIPNMQFNWLWFLCMGINLMSVVLIYLALGPLNKRSENINE